MPSQEDYLDGLLKGLSKELEELEIEQKELDGSDLSLSQEESELLESLGGLEEAQSPEIPEELMTLEEPIASEESVISEEPIISEEPESSLSQEESELLESLGGLEEAQSLEIPEELMTLEEPIASEESIISEEPVILEESDLSLSQEESELLESLGGLEEAGSSEVEETPEYKEEMKDSDFVGISEMTSMSEEEIEKLLAAGRAMEDDDSGDLEEDSVDIVDMFADSDDSELKEIQDLLEKSDKNEAVGDEIESLLLADQEAEGIPIELFDPDGAADEKGEKPSTKQQKALEKKRLKEEAAAAKKAKKAAKKAEKAAKKTKKAGNKDEEALDAETPEGVAVAEESIDTSLLDSILSEADKISSNEAATGLTGHYDAKVEGDLQNQSGENTDLMGSDGMADGDSVEDAEGLGLDLDSLFGNSDDAEEPVAVDGEESEFPDFVALDGEDVTGIAELTGEDTEEAKPRKKGFFARFFEFLLQEDEDEEEEKSENEDIQLSEENQGILNDLDKEKGKPEKKGKKGKKKDKKASASNEEGEEDGEEGDKKGKKKGKKPKKEKPPKEEEKVDPRKQLTLKKMMPIILFCLSLGLAIILLTNFSVDFTDKKIAREAYYDGDYQTCYQNLYGKVLNESEQVMFGKSESVLVIRLWIREYEMFAEEGSSLEALDRLIQAVNDYPGLYEYASQWNASGDVAVEYAVILNLLYENYGLTEEQARAIAAEPNDIEYTRQVNAIVQGRVFGSWNAPEPVVDAPLTDVLPEENELPGGNFIDTNTSAR